MNLAKSALLIASLGISGCSSVGWWSLKDKPTHPVDLCIPEAKTSCDKLPQLGETQPIGEYTVDVMLRYELCALKHEVLVRCAEAGKPKP